MIDIAIQHRFGEFLLDVGFRSNARTLALFGDSGAGKTSVLNAIAGLLDVQGRIAFNDGVLLDTRAGINVSTARRATGYVFQEGRLFPHLDVRRNLLYGSRNRTALASNEFAAVIELLGLGGLLARMPRSLSGGQRQRVAIGRALLSTPRILLLDEPLTGLHLEARAEVLEHLRRLKREIGIDTILVSHQPGEVAALADEVVLLDDGRVAGQLGVADFEARYAVQP